MVFARKSKKIRHLNVYIDLKCSVPSKRKPIEQIYIFYIYLVQKRS